MTRLASLLTLLAVSAFAAACTVAPQQTAPPKPAPRPATVLGPYGVNTTVSAGALEIWVPNWRVLGRDESSGRILHGRDLARPGRRFVNAKLFVRDPTIPARPVRDSTSASLLVATKLTLIVDGKRILPYSGGNSYGVAEPDRILYSTVFDVQEGFRNATLDVSVPSETSATIQFKLR